MNAKKFRTICSLLLPFLLLFSSCSQFTPTQEVPERINIPPTLPAVIGDPNIVVEGRLVPVQHIELSFSTSGTVEDVFVSEGELVESGQVLAMLEDDREFISRATIEAAIAAARLELVSAETQLDDLYENASLATAEAYQELTNAQNIRDDAARFVGNLGEPANQAMIEQAEANVAITEHDLRKAEEDFEPYENKPESNLTRANLLSAKADAQAHYDAAVRQLNSMLGFATDAEIAEAEADLVMAEARLEYAETRYEILKDGPDPDEIELAESRVANAEAQLAAAEADLADLEADQQEPPTQLNAPFTGTITELMIQKGEMINAGRVVIVLADFSSWYVETDDLTEINVVHVYDGEKATIVADAIPEVEMIGLVASISNVYEEKQGDVTYTARIQVDDIDPRLRWGMTVVVAFQEP